MSMKSNLGMLSMIAAIMGGMDSQNAGVNSMEIDTTPKIPPIPKGCKEYFFNKNGGFSTDKMRRDECVYKCVSSNDKSAKKKFDKWDKQNTF